MTTPQDVVETICRNVSPAHSVCHARPKVPSAHSPMSDIGTSLTLHDVSFSAAIGLIVLQKSFCTDDQKF